MSYEQKRLVPVAHGWHSPALRINTLYRLARDTSRRNLHIGRPRRRLTRAHVEPQNTFATSERTRERELPGDDGHDLHRERARFLLDYLELAEGASP